MTVHTAAGVVAQVVIDVPERRNALSAGVLRGLTAAINDLSRRDETRVIVLRGAGGTFSAGADVKEAVDPLTVVSAVTGLYEAIAGSPKPVLARIEGHCLGLAVGVVAACDLTVAAVDARFGLPESRLGQVATLAALTVVPRLRPSDANRLLLTGATFSGEHACEIGLVDRSVAGPDLDRAVDSWVNELTAGGPEALAACKNLLRTLPGLRGAEATAFVAELTAQLANSAEALHGRAAFLDRRPPPWIPPSVHDAAPGGAEETANG